MRHIARLVLLATVLACDLNDLADIAPDVLLSAQDINEAGQITGRVLDSATGEVLVFVATPQAGNP